MASASLSRPSDAHREFEQILDKVDAERGWNLGSVWRECLQMHRENDMLRTSVRELHVVLQAEIAQWAPVRAAIQKRIDGIIREQGGDGTLKTEELQELLKVNETIAKTIDRYNSAVARLAKEIRQTEFQSRFWFHVNQVQQFMMGLTAVLAKHFQSSDRLNDAVKDIRGLAKSMTVDVKAEEVYGE
jgi:hypothetical protein